jgi:hypothetical protein
MQPGNSATPAIVALIVAIAGTAILLNMDFGPSTAVGNDGLNKISLRGDRKCWGDGSADSTGKRIGDRRWA